MVKIITDSGSDVTQAMAEMHGITVLPLLFTFDGTTYYKDGVDMSYSDFYARLKESEQMPKTAQVAVESYENVYRENIKHPQVVISMSAAASGTFQAANIARNNIMEEFPNADITVVDSNSLSFVFGQLVVDVAQMSKKGTGKEEILGYLHEMLPRVNAYFTTDTLEYLVKGGRIRGAAAFLANVLDIRPVLNIKDGFVAPHTKIRGSKKLAKKLVELLKQEDKQINGRDIYVEHACNLAAAETLKKEIYTEFSPKSITFVETGCGIGCHAGPGLLAVIFRD